VKAYYLYRTEDVSRTSGTGNVAQVAVFDDGAAVVRWIGGMNSSGISSTTVFDSIDDLIKIHGHQGRTVLEPIFDSGIEVKELSPAQR
jgi:hypothetical protein